MASTYDDDIDWEAAVKEIDDACERVALASTAEESVLADSNEIRDSDAGKVIAFSKQKSNRSARQSRIDDFVGTNKKRGSVAESSRSKPVDSANSENVYVDIDPESAKTWIYPVNVPLRDYQFSIAKTALFANTLVVLPTGLGKTLVAAVVMYNYFRWFPQGKIVFAAPSRPLVMQQIEACHNIGGIPQEWTIDMTGNMKPSKRTNFWETKRVFFVTSQVLEKDIQSGRCLVKQLVCLVIDEAHHAMGKYSYCTAVRELMAVPVHARILALTATPGSKQYTIQSVIDNLHISVLEYRNESDHDVRKYTQSRQLELIKVPMGDDAVRISDLLLEAIRPFVSRLSVLGVLQSRDLSTLSPCQLLDSREKFRQSPPSNLPPEKYGEVEGCFTVLVSLYHNRMLLSSHGIRPAYEMLNVKMQQGGFSKLVCRNEALWNAKLLMQQSLSHGSPNPKHLKMLEVLTDHFKTNDPKKSRVIIFSNYRDSVRDIMESLSRLGEFIRATEFVGQSSGKSLKGQSQKVQQAVLQKFRTGGYNVIVATSIGEEGLDIMEVDLVICFDANVSPLRMIQRIGRTGRKHHGRVVILACEGNELKGYLNKQAKAKAVGKHMHNGGTNSFNFHPSPRMVPHIYKPEVQFVELSIEKFVPRGRKVKDDSATSTPTLKLSFADADLLAKYFHSPKEEKWKPSLIAFPHFQVFPSGVYRVRHSYRTTRMLIEGMQFPQEQVTVDTSKTKLLDEVDTRGTCRTDVLVGGGDMVEDECMRHYGPRDSVFSETNVDNQSPSEKGVQQCMLGITTKKVAVHNFLFVSNFVSVTAAGSVFISYVPSLPLNNTASLTDSLLKRDCKTITLNQDEAPEMSPSIKNCQNEVCIGTEIDELNVVKQTPTSPNVSSKDCIPGAIVSENKFIAHLGEVSIDTGVEKCELGSSNNDIKDVDGLSKNDIKDMDLSPRLSNFIEKGIVPETPLAESFHYYSHDSAAFDGCALTTGHKGKTGSFSVNYPSALLNRSLAPKCTAKLFIQSVNIQCQAPGSDKLEVGYSKIVDSGSRLENPNVQLQKSRSASEALNAHKYDQFDGDCSPTKDVTNKSCSEEWQLPNGDGGNSVQKPHKLKRLRRHGDKCPSSRTMSLKLEKVGTLICEDYNWEKPAVTKSVAGIRNSKFCVNDFIDEEAEVSSDVNVSEDEREDSEGHHSSFIDDRVNPTAAATQAEDMLAFYRRSLLTQSPMENCSTSSPMVTSSHSHTVGTFTCEKSSDASPRSVAQSSSTIRVAREPEGCSTSANLQISGKGPVIWTQQEDKMVTRKRKLIYEEVPSIRDATNNSRAVEDMQFRTTTGTAFVEGTGMLDDDIIYDDQFYESLDLDEIEAKATEMLRHKSGTPITCHPTQTDSRLHRKDPHDLDVCSPSFDLGI